jgi:hypothetical protein
VVPDYRDGRERASGWRCVASHSSLIEAGK